MQYFDLFDAGSLSGILFRIIVIGIILLIWWNNDRKKREKTDFEQDNRLVEHPINHPIQPASRKGADMDLEKIERFEKKLYDLEVTLNAFTYNTGVIQGKINLLKREIEAMRSSELVSVKNEAYVSPAQIKPDAPAATEIDPVEKAMPAAEQEPYPCANNTVPSPAKETASVEDNIPVMESPEPVKAQPEPVKVVFPEHDTKPEEQGFFSKELFMGRNILGIIASVLIFLSLAAFAVAVFPYLGGEIRFAIMLLAGAAFFTAGLVRQEKKPSVFNVVIMSCGIGSLFISLLCGRIIFGFLSDTILFIFLLLWGVACCFIYKRYIYRVFNIIGHLGIIVSVGMADVNILGMERTGTVYGMLLFTALYLVFLEAIYGIMFKDKVDRFILAASSGLSSLIMFHTVYGLEKGHIFGDFPLSWALSVNGVISVILIILVILWAWGLLTKSLLSDEMGVVAYYISALLLSFPLAMTILLSDKISFLPFALTVLTYGVGKCAEDSAVDQTLMVFDKVALGLSFLWLLVSDSIVLDYTGLYIPALIVLLSMVRDRRKYYTDFLFAGAGSTLYILIAFNAGERASLGLLISALMFIAVSVSYICFSAEVSFPFKIASHIHVLIFWFELSKYISSFFTGNLSRNMMIAVFITGLMLISFVSQRFFVYTKSGSYLKGEMDYCLFFTVASTVSAFILMQSMSFYFSEPLVVQFACYGVSYLSVFLLIIQSGLIKKAFGKKVWGMYDAVSFTVLALELARRPCLSYIVSVALLLCAVGCIIAGFKSGIKEMRLYAMALIFISTFKLVFLDIKQTSTIGKAASLFICGLLLFGISFLYGKMEQRYGGAEQ